MAEAAAGADRRGGGIDELAELVGAYCWVEHRIFELTGCLGDRAGGRRGTAAAAELRVWCAAASRRHGALAGRWAERLPVRAGVDPAELVRAPAGPLAGALERPGGRARRRSGRVGALVETVLPWLGGVYGAHLRTALARQRGVRSWRSWWRHAGSWPGRSGAAGPSWRALPRASGQGRAARGGDRTGV